MHRLRFCYKNSPSSVRTGGFAVYVWLQQTALSWSSLFGDSFSESFRFRTIFFVVCFCRDTACRVRQFQQREVRWKRSTGTFPKLRNSKRDTGRSGLIRSALEKLSLFSPAFSACQKYGAGNFAVCGQRLRGHVPSKNTSPAALSWSSLFGDSFSESFRFRTILFVVCFCRDTACRVRQFQQREVR